MRQVKELIARKDSPREAARRAGRAGAVSGVRNEKEDDKESKPAAVQADMQRLIAEVWRLYRRKVARV